MHLTSNSKIPPFTLGLLSWHGPAFTNGCFRKTRAVWYNAKLKLVFLYPLWEKKQKMRWWPQCQKHSSLSLRFYLCYLYSLAIKSCMMLRVLKCNITDLITTRKLPTLHLHLDMVLWTQYITCSTGLRSHSFSGFFYCPHLQTVFVSSVPREYFNTIMTASPDIQYNTKCVYVWRRWKPRTYR